jgi:hypothetical protein
MYHRFDLLLLHLVSVNHRYALLQITDALCHVLSGGAWIESEDEKLSIRRPGPRTTISFLSFIPFVHHYTTFFRAFESRCRQGWLFCENVTGNFLVYTRSEEE